MDIATLIGVIGIALVLFMQLALGGSMGVFINPPSMIGTFGGTIMALFMSFSLPRIKSFLPVIRNSFKDNSQDPVVMIRKLVGYAEKARKEGMLALEEASENENDLFLRKALRLAVD